MNRLTKEIQKMENKEVGYAIVTEHNANGVYVLTTRDGKKITAYNDMSSKPSIGDGVVVSTKSPATIIGRRRVQNTATVYRF